jgi:hypothetical protein
VAHEQVAVDRFAAGEGGLVAQDGAGPVSGDDFQSMV